MTQTQQTYLSRYGKLMFLHAVITHPHWKRQGYAKLLCKQSLQLARHKDLVVAALASPFSGYVFYSGTSFANCGRTAVEPEGEADKLELQVMVCTPPPLPEARRSSFMDFAWGQSRASTPDKDKRGSEDRPQVEERRSSLLDVLGLGGRKASSADKAAMDARRSSHH
ncbi:hypothetical protein FZEAL_10944 [Fusarium zealandicum]|uniref:N-acetyltransferase domain-containing protein n=1 Tax=Fusarium zealandicum TaxID=1053134 RepID=A0A8H4X626_9HYPO|nr:hypothetical protein FZEAL_10944 [Fusarium zealandicum]